ncbi:MAG: glycosyltransferase [Phormidesmis sp.]
MLSTPVAPLGSGLGGGVELTIINLAKMLVQRGHQVVIAAPEGSILPAAATLGADKFTQQIALIQVPGTLQPIAQNQLRSASITVASALANAWDYARQAQAQYDLLVNFAYDWLPFYLTPFLSVPVAHFVTMGSLSDAMDEAIAQLSARFPGTLGAYTQSQADTFSTHIPSTDPLATSPIHWEILGSAIEIDQYDCCDHPTRELAWAGRISPEKGLEDAIAAAIQARRSLNIFGKVEDGCYWQQIQRQIQQQCEATDSVSISYRGFLATPELQQALGNCQALLVTPRWIEAFGMVAIEALACGVPVIAYRRGGLAEIVRHNQTGYLVEPDDIEALVDAIARVDQLDRWACRQQAESMYSLAKWAERFEQWFYKIISNPVFSP